MENFASQGDAIMSTEQIERVIVLAQRVLQLRMELHQAEQDLARAMPEAATVLTRNGNVQPSQPTENDQDNRQEDTENLVERVIRLLNRNPQRFYTAAGVMTELGLPPGRLHSIRSTLWLLAKKGRIANTGRGQFRAIAP
jgi:hypothetical protein